MRILIQAKPCELIASNCHNECKCYFVEDGACGCLGICTTD